MIRTFLIGICASGMMLFSSCDLIFDIIFDPDECLRCEVHQNIDGVNTDIVWSHTQTEPSYEEEQEWRDACEEAARTYGGWCECQLE